MVPEYTCFCFLTLYFYLYFREVNRELKDYKKQLFQMVNANIKKEDVKKLKDRKKKELKAASEAQSNAPAQKTSKSRKQKRGQ